MRSTFAPICALALLLLSACTTAESAPAEQPIVPAAVEPGPVESSEEVGQAPSAAEAEREDVSAAAAAAVDEDYLAWDLGITSPAQPVAFAPATTTTPAPRALRVVVISDLNGSYGSMDYNEEVHVAMDRIIALRPDLVLSTGDMVAGQQRGLNYRGMWRAFHHAVSDRLDAAGIPFAVSPGNHDASGYSAFLHERRVYEDEWRRRRPQVAFVDDTHYPFRYSFTMGDAFFVALDATTLGELDAEQMAWLDAELAKGAGYASRIVFGHVPLYPFSRQKADETIGDPQLEALFNQHDVTAYISGHHHTYYPGRRGDLRLVGMACLGQGRRHLIGDTERGERSFLLLELDGDGVRQLDAFAGAAFDEIVPRASLPRTVGHGTTRIYRDDVDTRSLPAREHGRRYEHELHRR